MKKSVFNYKKFSILLWTLIAIILWYQAYSNSTPKEAVLITPLLFLAMFLTNTLLCNYLLPKAIKEKNMNIFWLQFVFLTFTMAFAIASILAGFKQIEESSLLSPSTISTGAFWTDFRNQIPAGLVMNLALVGLRFYYEHVKLEKTHLEMQLQVLKAQINPHFTFNVLNHIHYFIETKDDLASILLLKYSDILRYQLYSGKKDFVRLEDEIQFLKNYIDIEKIRWEDKLDIYCSWKLNDAGKEIPPLLLITLVENAFKHVSRTSVKKGYIRIIFEQKNGSICLEVENSKSTTLIEKDENSGIGIENLRNRLNILYYNKYNLSKIETDVTYYSKVVIFV